MPDERKLKTDYSKHSTRVNQYFLWLRHGKQVDEVFNNKTKEIDGKHNTKRIYHEVQRRDDYTVFHEIFKLNKDEINKMMVPIHNNPTIMQIEFQEYLKMMRRRNKVLVK